jgi:hypothetical protein
MHRVAIRINKKSRRSYQIRWGRNGLSTCSPKRPPLSSVREKANIQRFLADAEVPSRDELAAYWERVADPALKYLGRRPLTLVRRMGGKAYFHEGGTQRC